MDRRCLRSSHDVEGNGLVRVAAKATDFEIEIGVDDEKQSREVLAGYRLKDGEGFRVSHWLAPVWPVGVLPFSHRSCPRKTLFSFGNSLSNIV